MVWSESKNPPVRYLPARTPMVLYMPRQFNLPITPSIKLHEASRSGSCDGVLNAGRVSWHGRWISGGGPGWVCAFRSVLRRNKERMTIKQLERFNIIASNS